MGAGNMTMLSELTIQYNYNTIDWQRLRAQESSKILKEQKRRSV